MESSKGEPIPQLLRGRKAAVLVGDYFHIHEAYYPYFRLRESGVDVVFVGERENEVYHDYNGSFLNFVKRHVSNGALIVSVAEGHSILVSAGLLKGKEVAGPPEMKQDLENCGATVIDGPAWNDGPFITCRSTEDLPDIMRRILSYM